jgi:hypothetical protein
MTMKLLSSISPTYATPLATLGGDSIVVPAHLRELWIPKWSEAFRDVIEELTGQWTFRIALKRLGVRGENVLPQGECSQRSPRRNGRRRAAGAASRWGSTAIAAKATT